MPRIHNNEFWNTFNNRFNNYIDNFMNNMNNIQIGNGYSKSTQTVKKPDGSYTIIEKEESIKNGISDKKIKSYKIMKNGKIEPINYELALEDIKK